MTDIIESYWKGYEDAVRLLKRGLAEGLDPLAVVGCLEGAKEHTRKVDALLGGVVEQKGRQVMRVKCKECQGLGSVEVPNERGSDNMDTTWEDCEVCKGTGVEQREEGK